MVIARNYGGAPGIGGRFASSGSVDIPVIKIGDSANVTAYGGIGSAGIGGGRVGGSFAIPVPPTGSGNTIQIYGSAVVNAYGGNGRWDSSACFDGAGIGSGGPNTTQADSLPTRNQISISGTARVYAQGGAGFSGFNAGGGAGIGSGGVGLDSNVPRTPGPADEL
jgi:hypothetical protein